MSRRILAVALAVLASPVLAAPVLAAPVLASAQPYHAVGGPPDEAILPAPPADAPPGVCYAHVRMPGRTVMEPPRMAGAHWTRSPPPPGAIGPVWCLVPDYVAAHAVTLPDRFGWIRVNCDTGRPPPPRPRPCRECRPTRIEDGWLSWPGKRYF